jgi:copper ion binding protein
MIKSTWTVEGMSCEHMETITLRVEGMSCGHCEIAIQEAVRKLPGVKKAKARKRKKEVTIAYDASLVTPADISGAVAGTGYRVL